MKQVRTRFEDIAKQTDELQQNAGHIVSAMHILETSTEKILHSTTDISSHSAKNLVEQSELLQKIVNIFKTS